MQPHGYRRDRRARRRADRPAGAGAAHRAAGRDDDRQAARLPRRLAGRLRRRRPAAGARRHAHLRRRLEPRPLRAGAGPRAVPRRQRLLAARTCGSPAASRTPTRPRRPPSAASADRRACSSSRTCSAAAHRCWGSTPRELRRRNFYAAGQETPYGQPVRHPERLAAAWQQLHDEADVDRRLAEVAAFNAAHAHTKRALAITPVKFGISFNFTAFNQGGALVHVYKDGSVLVNHGGTEMGQGLHTKMLQVAATALGVPLARVRLAPTRTDKVPNTSATAASAGADLNGGAVKDACEQILRRLRRRRRRPWPAVGRPGRRRPTSAGCSCGRPASTGPRACTGTRRRCGAPVQVLRLRRRRRRGRGRRLHRRLPHPARRHRPRRRRLASRR